MPAVGLLAFSLVMPITVALLVMLALLILSYRETIKAYPSAGGAYLVTRDNFGIVPAQVAGAALLVGYILTVAVSVSAGTAALISQFEGAQPVPRADRARVHRHRDVREPAGRQGEREGLRRPHLLLHAQHGRAARLRRRGSTSAATSTPITQLRRGRDRGSGPRR